MLLIINKLKINFLLIMYQLKYIIMKIPLQEDELTSTHSIS